VIPLTGASASPSSVTPEWVQARGVRVFECDEHGPVDIPLSEILDVTGKVQLNPDIEQGDYFAVSLKAGKLTLRARGYVGYIPLNERIIVYVRPRVPVEYLTRIVAFAGCAPTALSTIRPYGTVHDWENSLADLYVAALADGVERILSLGLLQDYERREESSSFPKGRVMMHQTIQQLRSRNIRHSARVAWYARTIDNACNQCLRYALETVAHGYLVRPPTDRQGKVLQRRIAVLTPAFNPVTFDHSQQFLADSLVQGSKELPELRSYYRAALDVALAIIEKKGILLESTKGDLHLRSLVVNMDDVFERYVRRSLQLHAIENNWRADVLDGNKYPGAKLLFNSRPSPEANPDIVIRDTSGRAALVCDVKSIPVREGATFSDRDAINQVVTYGVTYRTDRVLLIHPCKAARQPSGLLQLGDIQNIGVYQYRFNLGVQDLVAERIKFGKAVGGLLEQVTGS
jgi:5-methylcytosine-specific restriction enzyme subunit McrC